MQKGQVLLIALCLFFGQGNANLIYKGNVRDGVGGVDGLRGVSCVVISPDGHQLYTASPYDNVIAWFSRDSISGACTYLGQCHSGITGTQGSGVYQIAVSSDGNAVYAMGYSASIAWFNRDIPTGALIYKGVISDSTIRITSLKYANSFVLPSDGKQCYFARSSISAGKKEVTMSWYNSSPSDGSLMSGGVFKDNVNRLSDVSWLCISNDDKTIYTTSALDLSISWFNRNVSTGTLSYGGTLKGGMDGMSGALGVTTSGDGKNVYIASVFSNALVWLTRIPSTGQLTYGGFFQDSSSINSTIKDTFEMNGAWTVAVNPNGRHIYVASILSSSISSFSRDTITGTPTFEGMIKNIQGLSGPTCISIDPSGKYVYVASPENNAVLWFEEDFATQALARSPSSQIRSPFTITKQTGRIEANYTTSPCNGNWVKLTIMTLDGRKIHKLYEGFNEPGTHQYTWDFRAGNGCRVSPGVYLCALTTDADGTVARSFTVGK